MSVSSLFILFDSVYDSTDMGNYSYSHQDLKCIICSDSFLVEFKANFQCVSKGPFSIIGVSSLILLYELNIISLSISSDQGRILRGTAAGDGLLQNFRRG